ncbi:MAG: sulfatase-like hydrolase/transferase [Chitinivibrionales bacterium]|nr:sulfatase-like hydrolase/transferase [Chitinivibrionales bacterium]MBD3355962.1 sulfatase-like hydrolase/transferase [Chitinivibrionales bacterium]
MVQLYSSEERKHEGVYRDIDWGHVLDAIEFIESKPPEPFCLFLALGNPHPPYAVEEPYFSRIDRNRLPSRIPTPEDLGAKSTIHKQLAELSNMQNWSEERWNELRAVYYGQCARVDDQFGRVLDAMKRAGLYDDSAVFFFSDHGDFTGDYGLVQKTDRAFDDCLVRVPMIIKPPKSHSCTPGIREQLVELVDFQATVHAMTGIAHTHTTFGRTLSDNLADPGAAGREVVFSEGGVSKMHWKRTQENAPEPKPTGMYWAGHMIDRSMSAGSLATMCRTDAYKYVKRSDQRDELYDLQNDPSELQNRIDDPAMTAVLTDMKERMLTWYHETCDSIPFDNDKRES